MKRVLAVFGVIVVLAVIGVVVFVATFDANRYRPQVIEKVSHSLGDRAVTLDRISLTWHGGVALRIKGLTIYAGPQPQGDPVLNVEALSAVVRLGPLLHKDVQVSSIVISRPRVQVRRDAQGRIDLVGLAAAGSPAAAPSGAQAAGSPAASVQIGSLDVDDGAIRWVDTMTTPPTDVWITRLDIEVRNISLTQPLDFRVKLSAFSDAQNVAIVGRCQLPSTGRPGWVEQLRVETDLARLKLADLATLAPGLRAANVREAAGQVTATIDRVPLDATWISGLAAQIRLTDGRVALGSVKSPIEHIGLEAVASPGRIELKQCAAQLAGGKISATGLIEHPEREARVTVQATIDELELDALVPAPPTPSDPRVHGRFSAGFQGTAQGLAWPQISQSLSGQGRLALRDGVISNLNLLRMLFERLSIVPGLVDRLRARLPASYQTKFDERDTRLQPVELPLTARQGQLTFQDLRIATDSLELQGAGNLGFDGTLASQVMARIDPQLSAAVIRGVNELQVLTDANGRLELPAVLSGRLPRVSVAPDLQYVASRLATATAQQLIGNLLDRALKKEGAGSAPASPTAP